MLEALIILLLGFVASLLIGQIEMPPKLKRIIITIVALLALLIAALVMFAVIDIGKIDRL